MGDFTATRQFIYVAGNVIDPSENNANENGIYNPFNNSINATTGHGHTGATGDGPKLLPTGIDLTQNYNGGNKWTGIHEYSGTILF